MVGVLTLGVVLSLGGVAVAQTWNARSSTDPIDDSMTRIVSLNSTEGRGGLLQSRPIELVARCQQNRTVVYFNWHQFVHTEDRRVTYRFDDHDAVDETWGVSTDREGLFVRSPIPFLRRLVESSRLVVRMTPYGENPITAIFDLGNGERAIAPLAETCNWILDRAEAERARAEAEAEAGAERARREAERAAERARREAEQDRLEAERARLDAEAKRRRAEGKRIAREQQIVELLNGPISAARLGTVGRVPNGVSALLRPDGGGAFVRLYFKTGVTVAALSAAKDRWGQQIVCERGGVEGEEEIVLRDCDLQQIQ